MRCSLAPTPPPAQAYCFPARGADGAKPKLTHAATWKIARSMTFTLGEGEELEGSEGSIDAAAKDPSNHPHLMPDAPAPAPEQPAPADAGAAKV